MRHGVKGRKLGRTASHRLATLKSLATSVFKYKRIKTTVAKAKEARHLVDKLITKAKRNDVHSRRLVAQYINDKDVVKELFDEVVAKIGERQGGYTRVIKTGQRLGDAAEMAILELVDYNDVVNEKATENKEKREAKAQAKKEAEEANVVEESAQESAKAEK
jgi:large subunit ribosomal protein L17